MKPALRAATAAVALLAPLAAFAQTGGPARRPAETIAHPAQWPRTASRGLVDARTEAFVTDLLGRMSLEEKVGQMIQADMGSIKPEDLRSYPLGSILVGGNTPPTGADERAPAPAWVAAVRAYRAAAGERRGGVAVPLMFGIDAVHGNANVRGATIFPHNIGLGAARDPALIRRIGEITALETAATGFDWAFGPTLAVPQDDRWGRTYEGYAEDPAVVRAYAGEMVRGLQGEPGRGTIQDGRVSASAKHFLADGATFEGTDQGDARIDERRLIDVHAQGYFAAIPAGTETVMASFSSWNGAKMHGNRSLLTNVLKDRLGFQGFVVGDWNGHGQVPGCTNTDCPQTFNAGLDMAMAPDSWKGLYDSTLRHARAGTIPMARIDDAVRRILRVKAKLGLFDAARPFEERTNILGQAAHRAVAREAVAKSLVLLKNNGSVLPIRPGARVLVTGPGADNIGMQTGGWTLSWQGEGNKNADFPGAQSIFAGIQEAVAAAGGTATLSADGRYAIKPDVALVVFGETPYAEMIGDRKTLEFQPGDKQALAQLRALKAAGVPTVAVFLSGRPLWVNPELNASDAFVAAWLPGSEGAGVADVLVAGRDGRPRRDFSGKLSYSWPRLATQFVLNRGQTDYRPLYPFGYGLSYADRGRDQPNYPEASGVDPALANTDTFFVPGREPPPWRFATDGPVTTTNVDAGGRQEGGRRFAFAGTGPGAVRSTGGTLDLTRQVNADVTLLIGYRVDARPSGSVRLGMNDASQGFDATSLFTRGAVGAFQSVKVPLRCFANAGINMSRVTAPFVLSTPGRFQVTISEVRLQADPTGAICPGAR